MVYYFRRYCTAHNKWVFCSALQKLFHDILKKMEKNDATVESTS